MIGYVYYKLALILLFIPATFVCAYLAKRFLKESNPIRLFFERHGIFNVADSLLFTTLLVLGISLTIIYN
jgi:hypothetical protein